KIPGSIKLDLIKLYNKILALIILPDRNMNSFHLINGLKLWMMTNIIVLDKLKRGGIKTQKMMQRKINNILNGEIMNEWRKISNNSKINNPKPHTILSKKDLDNTNVKRMCKL